MYSGFQIKATHVSNLTDARYFAANEVTWLGFPLPTDKDAVPALHQVRTMMEWVEGVKFVGEFECASAAEILQMQQLLGFSAVQAGMLIPPDVLRSLQGLTIFKEIVVEPDASSESVQALLRAFDCCCDFFLLDFTKNDITWRKIRGGESCLSVAFLRACTARWPVMFALDFNAENIPEIMAELRPAGISLSGSAEEKTGYKSFEVLDEILDALRNMG